jgi:uncharacterized protein YsxB (DUF464 family)
VTNVQVRRAADGSILEIRAKGHAGFAEMGEDIVCAAITALVCTALLGLEKVAKHPFEGKATAGLAYLKVKPGGTPTSQLQAQAILQTTVLGLLDIAEDYHQYVHVTEGG